MIEEDGASAEIGWFDALEEVATETDDAGNGFWTLEAVVERHGTTLTEASDEYSMVWIDL